MFKQLFFFACVVVTGCPLNVFSEKADINVRSYERSINLTTFESVSLNPYSRIEITLSDNSRWIFYDENPDQIINEISSHWKPGDDIRILTNTEDDSRQKYILKNATKNLTYLVDLDPTCCIEIHAHYIQQIDRNGYSLVTQDGLVWAIGWLGSFTSCSWKRGDHLIINKSSFHHRDDYLIINAETGDDVWASLVGVD
ncbi:MAG: hypothetical protein HW387_912 [Parachlamydiales bacterium]|nr:hypothetical protein [Parachlamydiales bacterium]